AEPASRPAAGGGPGSAHRGGDHPYVAEITPHGIEIEVGPVPQGVIRADVLIETEQIINSVLRALDRWNHDEELDIPQEITVYRYIGDSDFPRAPDGSIAGMIHPQRQDQDFVPLQPGDPLYLSFDGTVTTYDGPAGAVPLFVNEAAYYEKRAALTLAQPHQLQTWG
ncbi:MAG: succinylglutamate desuccinylase/aspartoacylase family protein, partial [Alkalispirochaeta sp.]